MAARRKTFWNSETMGYAAAVVAVAITTPILLALQDSLMHDEGNYVRPYGILYLIFVALIAALWGGRPGFLSLALAVLASKLFLMPPRHSLIIASPRDVIELLFLAVSGAIITLALDRLRSANEEGQVLLEKVSVQQQELQTIVDSMTDALLTADSSGRILSMNPAALRLYGFESRAEALKTFQEFPQILEVHYPDWRPVPVDQWPYARLLRGETFSHYELHVRRPDSGKFWDGSYAGTIVPGKNGNPSLLLLIVRDVSERQYMEQALRISEERLRFAVEGAEIGLWQWDIHTDQMAFSRRCKVLFGLGPDAEPTFEAWIERLHPEDRQRTRAGITNALEGKTEAQLEFRLLWPDGALHWIASRASGFYDTDGAPLRMEGIASEIVERRQGETIPSLEARNLPERLLLDDSQ